MSFSYGVFDWKFSQTSTLNEDDIRYDPPEWLPYFEPGGKSNSSWSARLQALREILTSDGRSLTQGAIGWLWARSENATPIPGARTPEHQNR
ncbi:MAG: aryl-alcohol dehydrogenase-like predicted oxidoreductase [Parasphingorhabdus sp.]|jgi:aryl-alcohol dehydrogenase-like predicted oxidoreductase